uniref:Ycf1 n=1 Tax=Boodleopsis sp. H.0758 TaxID=2320802 RepID=A0A386AZM6_9CHLO|nr:hypothetical protein Ycf1 [Boodleopsis sp. H.0758]AYC64898.1 hypothetical protein Ycf1 [Boodleopsis sp. H.0758]
MALIPLGETLKNATEVFNKIYETGVEIHYFKNIQYLLINYSEMKSNFLFYLKIYLNFWIDNFIKFKWANDFIDLPVVIPKFTKSIFLDFFNYTNLSSDINLNLTQIKDFSKENLFISFFYGFSNSLFLYLPVSAAHLIWLRKLVINGSWVGRAASFGIILGNLSLLSFFLFGWRDKLNIWFSLEPFSYFMGVYFVFLFIYEVVKSPLKIIRKSKKNKRFVLKSILISFILVCTDQSGVYPFLRNLSLHSGTSIIDLSDSDIIVSIYFLGIIFGSFFWTTIISATFSRLGILFCRLTKLPYSFWIRNFNYFCLIGSVSLTVASFAYYSPGYLFSNPIGLMSQDNIIEISPLPQLKPSMKDAPKGKLGEKSSLSSIDTDLSFFDRGVYTGGPVVESHIESLNYQREYAWRSRYDKLSTKGLNKNKSFFAKYFKISPEQELLRRKQRRKKSLQKYIESEEFINYIIDRSSEVIKKSNVNNYIIKQETLKDYYFFLIERFIEDFTAEATKNDTQIPELLPEKMIYFSAFSELMKHNFDLFAMFESSDLDPLDTELSKEIKEHFSNNKLYKLILNLDISTFLKRQPISHILNTEEEISLFYKRITLSKYYDTLRSYAKIPFNEIFGNLFCGPKSYSNRIYNQQFKGTIKIVERLFAIHLEDEKNIQDLPYEKNKEDQISEEELKYIKIKQEPSVLKYDQPLFKEKISQKNPLLHEEFLKKTKLKIKKQNENPFLRETNPLPFFMGWDNDKRKFVITNRLLTYKNTLLNTSILINANTDIKNKNKLKSFVFKDSSKKISKNKRPIFPIKSKSKSKWKSYSFNFTTWPMPENLLKNNFSISKLHRTREEMLIFGHGDDVFSYMEPLMNEETVIYNKLPNVVERIDLKNQDKLNKSLAPKIGGFFWPGVEQN